MRQGAGGGTNGTKTRRLITFTSKLVLEIKVASGFLFEILILFFDTTIE
jgi:hypothetical protein